MQARNRRTSCANCYCTAKSWRHGHRRTGSKIRMLEGGCNNLNQLTKMAHQQGFSLLKGKIMDLLDEFNKIIGKI